MAAPSLLSITNLVLSKLGRKPVQDVNNSDDSLLISQQIPLFLQDLLMRYTWNFSIKYFFSNTPLTSNISDNVVNPPEFLYNYQLPADYGRFFRWEFPLTAQFGLYYEILDGIMMTSLLPINFYYIVNDIDIPLLPPLFQQALIYFTAWQVCAPLTNNIPLKNELDKDFEIFLGNAIQQNDMELYKQQVPYSDFNRQTYI